MPGVQNFTDLLIWQRARQWSKRIFDFTQKEPFSTDRRLVVQINDSSESVMSNVAEGFGRGTQGEFVTFLGYSLGSLNETQSHFVPPTIENTWQNPNLPNCFPKGPKSVK